MGWIISFSYELMWLSTLLILGMTLSLLLIIERIYKHRAEFPTGLAGFSFTLYSAWVFIASILNVAILLVQLNWGGFGLSDSLIFTSVFIFESPLDCWIIWFFAQRKFQLPDVAPVDRRQDQTLCWAVAVLFGTNA